MRKTPFLPVTHPELYTQVHPRDQEEAARTTRGSRKRFLWLCVKGHEWEANVSNRTRKGNGCPYCSGRRATKDRCFAVTHPKIAAELHPENKELGDQVAGGSHKMAKWQCSKGHIWKTKIGNRILNGSGCPYCIGKKVDKSNCLKTTHPQIAKELHPDNAELADLVTVGSRKIAKWRCSKGHEWEVAFRHRVSKERIFGCPYCSNLKVNSSNCIATTHPALAKELHPKDAHLATTTTAGSAIRAAWLCKNGHEWETPIWYRGWRGAKCSECSPRLLATEYPHLIKELHPASLYLSKKATSGSRQKARWVCKKGHEWEAEIRGRTRGGKCPVCSGVWSINRFNKLLRSRGKGWLLMASEDLEQMFQSMGVLYTRGPARSIVELILSQKLAQQDIDMHFLGGQQGVIQTAIDQHDSKLYRSQNYIPHFIRDAVRKEKGDRCLVCHTNEHVALDHIVPRIQGGKTVASNFQPLCKRHNSMKGGRSMTIQDLLQREKDLATS